MAYSQYRGHLVFKKPGAKRWSLATSDYVPGQRGVAFEGGKTRKETEDMIDRLVDTKTVKNPCGTIRNPSAADDAIAYELASATRWMKHSAGGLRYPSGEELARDIVALYREKLSIAKIAKLYPKHIIRGAHEYYRGNRAEIARYVKPSVVNLAAKYLVENVVSGDWKPVIQNPPLAVHIARGECKPVKNPRKTTAKSGWVLVKANHHDGLGTIHTFPTHEAMVAFYTSKDHKEWARMRGSFFLGSTRKTTASEMLTSVAKKYPRIRFRVV